MCLIRSMPDASAGFLLLHVACTRVYGVGASAWAAVDVALLYEPQVARARALLAIRSNRTGAKELANVTVRKGNETKKKIDAGRIGSDRIGSRAISHTNRLLAAAKRYTRWRGLHNHNHDHAPMPPPSTYALTSHTFGTFV